MYTFGPIPSRRLGSSLGINNIPPKICTYSCVYCQLGNTIKMQIFRNKFYEPDKIIDEVKHKVEKVKSIDQTIDYLTIVPDGEPTLDRNLGRLIDLLKEFEIKIAIITNSSLIGDENVRNDLRKADWVSLKVDSVVENIWRKIDRPHGKLELNKILDGIRKFADIFKGDLFTETMLVNGINDDIESLKLTSRVISEVSPKISYLSVPTRPPALNWVKPPDTATMNRAFQIFSSVVNKVEFLISYEGNDFVFTDDLTNDLLSITSVHPMRKDAVEEFISKANSDWSVIEDLLNRKELVELQYGDARFYLRNLGKKLSTYK